jgi:ATP-binding cassette, subfamily F, member 3
MNYLPSECNKNFVQKVDQKKLDKAQAKLQQKQDKRSGEILKVTAPKLETASASQVLSKKENKMESKGTNRATDVRIENFDIAYGDK